MCIILSTSEIPLRDKFPHDFHFNFMIGYLYSLNASTLSMQWEKVNVESFTRAFDLFTYFWPLYIKEILIVLMTVYCRCGTDGPVLAENRSFFPTSSSDRKLRSSLQGPLEILVTAHW